MNAVDAAIDVIECYCSERRLAKQTTHFEKTGSH